MPSLNVNAAAFHPRAPSRLGSTTLSPSWNPDVDVWEDCGAELEYNNLSQQSAVTAVAQALGVPAPPLGPVQTHVRGRDGYYTVKPDPTCGGETTSYVMVKPAHLEELKQVASALNAQPNDGPSHVPKSGVNTGFHVHMSTKHFTVNNTLQLLAWMARFEPALYRILGVYPHRRAEHCEPLDHDALVELLAIPPTTLGEFRAAYSATPNAVKRKGLNLLNMLDPAGIQTFEFRYMNGTLNAKHIACCVRLIQAIGAMARRHHTIPEATFFASVESDPELLLRSLALNPTGGLGREVLEMMREIGAEQVAAATAAQASARWAENETQTLRALASTLYAAPAGEIVHADLEDFTSRVARLACEYQAYSALNLLFNFFQADSAPVARQVSINTLVRTVLPYFAQEEQRNDPSLAFWYRRFFRGPTEIRDAARELFAHMEPTEIPRHLDC